MRLSISNIAWNTSEDKNIAKLLKRYGINAIDIAPGKYFPEPYKAADEEIARIKRWWAECDIEIVGMQSLLFGTVGLNVFGSSEVQHAMLQHLNAVCRIGAILGATRLVFGSPKNRDRTGLTDEQVMDIAIPFFKRLGDIAQFYGVMICLEPNPPCYGANFMVNNDETLEVVRQIAHPAIRMQIDTGAMTINNENFSTVLQNSAMQIGHIHASEPGLVPLGDGKTDHAALAATIIKRLPNLVVSIEMLGTDSEPNIMSIERALKVAIQHYRNEGNGGNK